EEIRTIVDGGPAQIRRQISYCISGPEQNECTVIPPQAMRVNGNVVTFTKDRMRIEFTPDDAEHQHASSSIDHHPAGSSEEKNDSSRYGEGSGTIHLPSGETRGGIGTYTIGTRDVRKVMAH